MERKNSLRPLLFTLLCATIIVIAGPTLSRASAVRVKSEVHAKPGGYTVWYIVTSRKGFQPGDKWTLYTDSSKFKLPSGSCWHATRSGKTITFESETWTSPPAAAVFVVYGRKIGKISYSYNIESKSGGGKADGPCKHHCNTAPPDLTWLPAGP